MNNSRKIQWSLLVLLGFILMGYLLVTRCDFRKITDPMTFSLFKGTYYGVSLHDARGETKTDFYSFETLFIRIKELQIREQYDIQLIRLSDNTIIKRAVVLANQDGEIFSLPLWYDIGTDSLGHEMNVAGDYVVHIQGHNREPFIEITVPFKVINGPNPTVPHIRGTRGDSTFNGGSVVAGDPVYAKGSSFPPAAEVRLYIVSDKRQYEVGDHLADESGGFETVTTTANGSINNTLVWNSASIVEDNRNFDIVADVAPLGEYNYEDAVGQILLTGFVVQRPASSADIVTQLACNLSGTYKDIFESTAAISVWANPPRRPLHPSSLAAVYVVSHQDEWADGDLLVAIPTVLSHEMPSHEMDRFLCGNLFIFNIIPEATSRYPRNLLPGKYDVIIDVGRDGFYNPGTDILDGGSEVGFTVPGTPPPVLFIASASSDFLLPDETISINVKVRRGEGGPISDVPVEFAVVSGSGNLTITSTTTNSKGTAASQFSGGTIGQLSEVRVTAHVEDTIYSETLSIWVKLPFVPHDQGGIE